MIALWPGHESTGTTPIYVEIDLGMKKRAIDKITMPGPSRKSFKASDSLLAFLETL